MMRDDETDPLMQILRELRQFSGWQKRTAQAVTNLSLGLDTEAKQRRRDHDAQTGLILSVLPGVAPGRKRRDSSDDTDTFKLPGGNRMELTRRTQKRVLQIVLLVLAFIGTHAANYFLMPRPQPPAVAAPRVPDVVTGPTRLVPALTPPKAP